MFTTTKDIIKDLSKELDMPPEMVEKNVKYLISRLRDVMHQEDVLEIRLSDKLGTMFCNRHTISHRRRSIQRDIKRSTNTDKFKKIHERLDKKFKYIMSHRDEKLYSNKIHSYQRHVTRSKRFLDKMSKKEIQDFQNIKYNESIKRN